MQRSFSSGIAWVLLAVALMPANAEVRESEGLKAVNGTELWVKRVGSGEPIVVVHGGPVMEHGYLAPHVAFLAEDYELVFYDQRLSGRSAPEVEPGTVRLAEFTADIEALREKLGLGRIHLMGHSWGGLIAMDYARHHEQHLRSLVLLDSIPASAELWREEQAAVAARISDADRAERQQLMATEAFVERRPEAIEKLLLLSFRPQFHDPSKLARLKLHVPGDYSQRSRAFGEIGPDLEAYDLHADLGKLRLPTLILFGASEPGATVGGAALHAAIEGSELVLIENAGHFPFIEKPEEFSRIVRRFLAAVGGS